MSIKDNEIQKRLKLLVDQNGGDLFGVANLAPAREFMIAQGGEILGKFPRAVSIAIRLSDVIVDQQNPEENREDSLYLHHVYEVVNPALNSLARRIYSELQAEGYQAFPIPASVPYNKETLKGILSHKLAAHLAGLGWIGKNCLFITPEFGPRVRLVTILTNAPLSPGRSMNEQCGKCTTCVINCPSHALKGIEFQPEDPLEVRFDNVVCNEYRRTHPCGMCMAICPVGLDRTTNQSS